MIINYSEKAALTEIATDYSVAIGSSYRGPNPDWACKDGFDIFFANVDSLIGELSVELDQSVLMVALDHEWRATCFRTGTGWRKLTGEPIMEQEVFRMVQSGVWMALSN